MKSETKEEVTKRFRQDWVTHLGNRMSSEQRDSFVKEIVDIVENPQTPMEYLISYLVMEQKP